MSFYSKKVKNFGAQIEIGQFWKNKVLVLKV